LSEKQLAGFTVLVLVSRFHAPQAARIVFDALAGSADTPKRFRFPKSE